MHKKAVSLMGGSHTSH